MDDNCFSLTSEAIMEIVMPAQVIILSITISLLIYHYSIVQYISIYL